MSFLRGLPSRAFVLRELVRRDLEARYAGSALGFAWSFILPLWQLALFTGVFSVILRVPLIGEGTKSFPVFLFAGLLPWIAFQEAVSRAVVAITENAALVKRLSFPAESLVLAVVLAALVHEGIAVGVFVVVLGFLGELAPAGLPWLLPALLCQFGLTLGIGLFVAAVQVFLRDTVQAVGLVLGAWFYLTPVVYPTALVPSWLRPWLELNPFTGVVGLYRAALFGSAPPSLRMLGISLTCALLSLVVGARVFRAGKPRFPDEV